jgi:hypothetical protein
MFRFLRSLHIVFQYVLPCIPTFSVGGFLFPTSLPTFVGGGVFDDSYSNRGEVESLFGFDLHFLYDWGC